MTSFQERFKGKTALMTKEGVNGVIKDSDNPIPKINERTLLQTEDFTGAHRYASQKKEAQTFDINRPFLSPDRIQSSNIYSVTYNKPNKSVDQYQQVHNQPQNLGFQQALPPRYPQQGNQVNQNRKPINMMNELDSIDQQMEQIKYNQQIQQHQFQAAQNSRQGFNSNYVTPNGRVTPMKLTFQTDNGVPLYSINRNPQQFASNVSNVVATNQQKQTSSLNNIKNSNNNIQSQQHPSSLNNIKNNNNISQQPPSLNSIKSNNSATNKKSHQNAPVSANLNNRSNSGQPQQSGYQVKDGFQNQNKYPYQQQNNLNYQNDMNESKLQNVNQYSNIHAKNGYNILHKNGNQMQSSSRELLMPNQPQLYQVMSVQQQPTYLYQMQNNNNNNNFNNNGQMYQQQNINQSQLDQQGLNSRAYSARFKYNSERQGGSSHLLNEDENMYEEAPFLKEYRNNGEPNGYNFSKETTNSQLPSQNTLQKGYKPYTLNEYKHIKKSSNYKLGGLGPNIGNEEWQQKKEQQEKRQEFAKQINQINSQILKSQQEQGKVATIKYTKEVSTREKALDFAKKVPKPQTNIQKQSAQSSNTLAPVQDNQQNAYQQNRQDNYENNINFYEGDGNNLNISRSAQSMNNYSTRPYEDDQQNQPDFSMPMNQNIDFHEQQHLDFLDQIEKFTK